MIKYLDGSGNVSVLREELERIVRHERNSFLTVSLSSDVERQSKRVLRK